MDPGTGLSILGGAIGGAKVAEKILGPTAEYIGEQIKEWTEKRINNTARIFQNANSKLGDKINQEGNVSPKVLKGILEDGAWCEEDLQIEYFGGVLASSRGEVSRDDRGAYYTNLISKLTTYQIRTHYLFYHLIKKIFDGRPININDGNEWWDLQVYLPYSTYFEAMDFNDIEYKEVWNILSHSTWGLNKEQLISDFSFGQKDHLIAKFPQANNEGIVFKPSKLGVELFLWANGYGKEEANIFFLSETKFKNDNNIKIGEAYSTKEFGNKNNS